MDTDIDFRSSSVELAPDVVTERDEVYAIACREDLENQNAVSVIVFHNLDSVF